MRVALVTGGSGLVGRELIGRLSGAGVRVLATARSIAAERAVREAGAEPLHTDLANIGGWAAEAADAEVVFHLGLPRLTTPLRPSGVRRRARAAGSDAAALAALAGGRPVVLASSGLLYGDRAEPAVDDDPATGGPVLARIAGAAEEALAGSALRTVRLPWVYGPGGLMREVIVGLRVRRHRIVGGGGNAWALLGAADAAAALVAAAGAPPGAYTAAEPVVPTQAEVVATLCSVPGHRRPDHAPLWLASFGMGGAMARALAAPLDIRTGRLAEHGWAPAGDWRRDLVRLAEAPLPLPE